jgi:C4-dicarboxylate-specific signal transduction histidine kinase
MNYVDYAGRVARSDEASGALAKALEELERMRDLLQNMLTFARPAHEPTSPVELRHVVESALALVRPELSRRGIVISMEFGDGLPKVLAREEQLQQVVVHLLMNARDALEETQDGRVRVRGLRQGDLVALEVEDSGPGVPEGIRDRVFDPFFTTKPPGRGTGLGLSVSRSIMLELGGDLTFKTADGRGAVFTLLLPIAGERGRG